MRLTRGDRKLVGWLFPVQLLLPGWEAQLYGRQGCPPLLCRLGASARSHVYSRGR